MTGMGTNLPLIPIGTMARWGKVQAVGCLTGERYYWMVDARGSVAMIPATSMDQKDSVPEVAPEARRK